MPASKTPVAQRLERNRKNEWTVSLYKAGGLRPHALSAGEEVECRLWNGTDGSTPYVLVSTEEATDNGSIIVVNDEGNEAESEAAIVTITIEEEDAQLVTAGAQQMEIVCVLDGDRSVVCRCALNVDGSPA